MAIFPVREQPDQALEDCVRVCSGPAPALVEEAAGRLAGAWREFTSGAPAAVGALAGA